MASRGNEESNGDVKTPLFDIIPEGFFDISPEKDCGVLKKILQEGDPSSPCPTTGAKISIHYTGSLMKDGSVFDTSSGKDLFECDLGKPGDGIAGLVKGWDIGIATMRIGERCIFNLAPCYAFAENGSPPVIGPNEAISFDVELCFFWQPKQLLALPKEEQIAEAERAKERGTFFFKRGDCNAARGIYLKVHKMLQSSDEDDWDEAPELREKSRLLVATCFCNAAAMAGRLCRYKDAVDDVRQGLDLIQTKPPNDDEEGENSAEPPPQPAPLSPEFIKKATPLRVKLLYRRSQVYRAQGEFEVALRDVSEALALSPTNRVLLKERQLIFLDKKKRRDREKQAYSGMFERMSRMEESGTVTTVKISESPAAEPAAAIDEEAPASAQSNVDPPSASSDIPDVKSTE